MDAPKSRFAWSYHLVEQGLEPMKDAVQTSAETLRHFAKANGMLKSDFTSWMNENQDLEGYQKRRAQFITKKLIGKEYQVKVKQGRRNIQKTLTLEEARSKALASMTQARNAVEIFNSCARKAEESLSEILDAECQDPTIFFPEMEQPNRVKRQVFRQDTKELVHEEDAPNVCVICYEEAELMVFVPHVENPNGNEFPHAHSCLDCFMKTQNKKINQDDPCPSPVGRVVCNVCRTEGFIDGLVLMKPEVVVPVKEVKSELEKLREELAKTQKELEEKNKELHKEKRVKLMHRIENACNKEEEEEKGDDCFIVHDQQNLSKDDESVDDLFREEEEMEDLINEVKKWEEDKREKKKHRAIRFFQEEDSSDEEEEEEEENGHVPYRPNRNI